MINFDGVSFRYQGASTITDLTFRIGRGEFAALIGSNGAGKSTTLRLARGLLKPDAGRIEICGCENPAARVSSLAAKVGFLFQNPDRQICKETVRDEIAFSLTCVGLDKSKAAARAEEIAADFEFDPDRSTSELSRGERQRLALASVMAPEPEILLLDEPTTGLDYRECTRIMERVSELNRAGVTVLMVSHDMEVVADYAQRVLVLNAGTLVDDGDPRRIFTESALVTPPQIPALSRKLGGDFSDAFTTEEMILKVINKTK